MLERYLADLHAALAGTRRHGACTSASSACSCRRSAAPAGTAPLPASRGVLPRGLPARPELLPRALAEHVMAQVEDPASLDRWDNPASG